jgi:hypothetical protein
MAVESPMGGVTEVTCRDGRTIRLEVGRALRVIVATTDAVVATLELAMPSAGYGGHELVLSPGQTCVALWLYSGQSEVGYELLELVPSLRRVGGLPYVFGEGFGPAFAPDGGALVLAWATNPGLTVDDAVEATTSTATVLEWATVHLAPLPDGAARQCVLSVRVPAGAPAERDDSYWPSNLEVTTTSVRFDTGWGLRVELPVPLPDALTIDGPRTGML